MNAGETTGIGPMPRVDFYLLKQHVPNGRLVAICRLSQKIYTLGYTISIQAPDSMQAKALDDLMWTFDQGSFIPHDLIDETTEKPDTPVTIAHQPPSKHCHNVLISMLEEVPEYFDQYQRVAEIVDNTQQDRVEARERYRVYRQRGCSLETHDI